MLISVRSDPELSALANDLRHFHDDSGCSSWMRLHTLGARLLVSQVVPQLLLACAPFPDVVTGDALIGITLGRTAADALLAGQENRVSACNSWFSQRLSKSMSVTVQGEYFD